MVYNPTWSSHLKHLEVVLQLLRKHKLLVKLPKCSFGLTQVEYLGYTVSGQGVAVDASKIQVVLAWPLPKNLKQLRGFLGLTSYYRKFIKSNASIAAPLANLLKKDNFNWQDKATTAFETLKKTLTQAPVFAIPHFSKAYVLEIDASGTGIGAILSKNNQPVAFFSKKLTPKLQK